MQPRDRTAELAEAFVELSRTMTAGHDTVDLLDRIVGHCVGLLDIDDAGVVLADPKGTLKVMASTSEQVHFLELFQLQEGGGPCLECYHSGEAVAVADLAVHGQRWPEFAAHARREGYRSVHATPLKESTGCIGALNVFSTRPSRMRSTDFKIAQALADVAAVAILHQRALLVADQLQHALSSRAIIEQAKGKLAQQGSIGTGAAFVVLRNHVRRNNQRLTDAAHAVVEGTLTLDEIRDPKSGAAEAPPEAASPPTG